MLISYVFINVDELDLSFDFVYGVILFGIELKLYFFSNKKSYFLLVLILFVDNLIKLILGLLFNLVVWMF